MPIRPPNEDLFEESRMSFGEHLEELRKVLVRALYGLAISCILGFYFANNVVQFLQQPLKEAIGDFKIARAEEELKKQNGGYLPPELRDQMKRQRMIPQVFQIDPAQLVEALRNVSGSKMEEVDLTPYRYVVEEVKPSEMKKLVRLWLEGDDEADEVLATKYSYLRSQLNDEERKNFESILTPDNSEDENVQLLVDTLNSLIDRPAIHESEAFAAELADKKKPFYAFWMDEPDNTKHLMKKAVDEAEDNRDLSRRLNHLLVSETFAEQLEPPHIPMSSIQLWKPAEVNPQSLTAPEVFMIWVKAGVITGLFIASPWLFYQIWVFVAAGLYKHEQRYVYIYLPFSLTLFFSGAALSFFFVFKPVLSFLFEFNAGMGIEPQPRIGDWLSFVMFLPLGFGIAFQLPLVMLMLNRIGLFELQSYLNKWRVAILVIFVVSMFLTPADPISLILLAIPLSFLYFLGIGLCKWMPRGRNPFGEELDEV